jgi:hypothetical protein
MLREQKIVLRLNYLFPRKDGSEQITIEMLDKRISRSKEIINYHDNEKTLYSRHNITYLNLYRQNNISCFKVAKYIEENVESPGLEEVTELQLLKA